MVCTKKYLLWSLNDCLSILNNQEDGFSTKFEADLLFAVFYRFMKRHKQFVYQRDIPETSCLCEVYENAAMMAKALRKEKSGHPTNAHDIVEKYSCDSNDPKCMKDICEECEPTKIIDSLDADSSTESSDGHVNEPSDDDEPDSFSFKQWIRQDKKIKKVMKNLEKSEFYDEWEKMVLELKEHIHRKRIQASAYNACKIDLAPGEALIHIDYSESYKNKQQDEIQSAYFGQPSLSLFTACVYHLDSIGDLVERPITVVSESSNHSRIAALTCIDFVIKEVEKQMKLTKAIIWSDGCAAQFRFRFVFKLLSTYRPNLLIDWHYNEAHHGKGPMDGIGGTIKNVVFRHVKSERIIVNSAKEFSEAANQFCLSITTLFQRSDVILSEPKDVEEAPIIPGI